MVMMPIESPSNSTVKKNTSNTENQEIYFDVLKNAMSGNI